MLQDLAHVLVGYFSPQTPAKSHQLLPFHLCLMSVNNLFEQLKTTKTKKFEPGI